MFYATNYSLNKIYSIGDSTFLYYILNGVAMIVKSDGFFGLLASGVVFGLILLSLQAVISSGKFDVGKTIMGIVVLMMMYGGFGSSYDGVEVEIVDIYNPAAANKSVDGIPFGIATVGSAVSFLGFKITELMETAFMPGGSVGNATTSTSLLKGGFMPAVDGLLKLRRSTLHPGRFSTANSEGGGDFTQSWTNYIKDCTLIGVDKKKMKPGHIMAGKNTAGLALTNTPDVLKYESVAQNTVLNLDGTDTYYTCKAGHAALKTYTTAFAAKIGLNLRTAINRRKMKDNLSTNTVTLPDATAMDAKVSEYLEAVGLDTFAARDFMVTSVLLPIYGEAVKGKYMDALQGTTAVMINQAIQQRNTKWAAEQSLFRTVVRPMMTFFEGFIYAVTPLVTVMMGIGMFGIKLAGKYLMILVMMQLWMPILSIINLFAMNSLHGQMSAIIAESGHEVSFYTLMAMDLELQNWVSTAGMLAASTPALAIMLVMGGAVATSSMMSRMRSSEHINEKIASPDVVEPKAALTMDSRKNMNQHLGSENTGMSGLMRGVSLQNVSSSLMESSKSRMKSAAESSSHDVVSDLKKTWNEKGGRQKVASMLSKMQQGTGKTAQYARQFSSVQGFSKGTSESSGEGKSQRNSSKLAVGGEGAISGKIPIFGPAGSVSMTGKAAAGIDVANMNTKQNGKASESSKSWNHSDGANFTESDLDKFENTISSDAQDGTSEGWERSLAASSSESTKKSYNDTLTSSESLKETEQRQKSFSSSKNATPSLLHGLMGKNGSSMSMMNNRLHSNGQMAMANQKKKWYQDTAGFDKDRAASAAAFDILGGGNDEDKRIAESAAHVALGESPVGMPGSGASVGQSLPQIQFGAGSNTGSMDNERSEVISRVEGNQKSRADMTQSGNTSVESKYQNGIPQYRKWADESNLKQEWANDLQPVDHNNAPGANGAANYLADKLENGISMSDLKELLPSLPPGVMNTFEKYGGANDEAIRNMAPQDREDFSDVLLSKGIRPPDALTNYDPIPQKKKLTDSDGSFIPITIPSGASLNDPVFDTPHGNSGNNSFSQKVAEIESGGGKYVNPSKGHSYAGTYQFNEDSATPYLEKLGFTWDQYLESPQIQEDVYKLEIEDIKSQYANRGIPATELNVWGAHNMGVQGFSEILDSDKNGTPLKEIRKEKIENNLPKKAVSSNEPTASDYIQHYGKTFSDKKLIH